MIFSSNKILTEGDSLAEQLKKARTEKNLELAKIAEKLNINLKYLEALEQGEFSKLPAGVYGKNFLREYASFLGLDFRALLTLYENETEHRTEKQKKDLFSKQVIAREQMLALPKILRNLILALIVVVCLVFLATSFNKIVSSPKLLIINPPDNLITKNHAIEIIGVSEAESQIIINGEQLAADSSGNFYKKINLRNGLNTITITAQKKYGRSSTAVKQILVEGGQ